MTAPVLSVSASPVVSAVLEGAINPGGITVAALVVNGSITDDDSPGGAIEAIAIEAVNSSLGTWQYSLNNGTTWLTIETDLLNSSTNTLGLLLGPTNLIRLLPYGDMNGTLASALTFRAWDTTSGAAGQYVVTAPGQGAFSVASDTASLTVTAVNDFPTFAPVVGTGKVVTDFGSGTEDAAYSVTVQADGKILAAGYSSSGGTNDFALVRYNVDGSLDTSFNGTGKLVSDINSGSDDTGKSVTVQADGKILVAGYTQSGAYSDFAVVRYNANGSLDTSFGDGTGKVVTYFGVSPENLAYSVTSQSDGKILIAGYTNSYELLEGVPYGSNEFGIIRLNTDGSLDTSFNGTGKVVTDFGYESFDIGYDVTVQSDGKILVAGYSNDGSGGSDDFAVARYNPDGSLDLNFGDGTGKVVTDFGNGSTDYAYSITVQADGKFVVVGESDNGGWNDFAVARYNANGTPDTSFSGDGLLVTDIGIDTYDIGRGVTVQADGKIVVAGYNWNGNDYDFVLVRLNAIGALDTSFNGTGKVVTDIGNGTDDLGRSVSVQPDGKIVVAGEGFDGTSYDFAVVRYNIDGSLDTTFNGVATPTLGGSVVYTEQVAAVALDTSVAIFDAELAALASGAGNYNGASLTVSRSGGANAQDFFSALGNLTLAAGSGSALLSGVAVGSFTNASGTLVISFNNNATQARVNEVLSSLAYANSSDAPPASVVINYVFSDGNSGAQGSGAALGITGSKTVNITPLNDTPLATNLSAAESYIEDTALNLTNIVITDVDSANVTATLTLSNIAAGALSTATSGAVSSTYAADTGMWSASGALADVNTLLAGVSFNPTLNFNGNFTVTTSVSDGVAAAITGSKAFNGTPVNDAPVTAPVALGSSPEDAVISITPAQLLTGVTDLDTAPASLNITALSIASGGGVLTPFFVSPGWSYTPAADYSGPVTFNYTASDGQLGSPGTASLTITPVNDAPTATNLSAAEAYTEDTALNLTDIVASDVDSANVTATLTLSNIAAGALSTATSGAVTSTYAADTGVWSASGALADVNALLAGVTFNPAGNFNSAFTLATSVSDGVAPAITGAKAFTGTPVNDAPTATNLSAAEAYTEDTALNLIDIVASDVDSANVTATLTLSSIAAGALSTATSGAVTSTYAADTGMWSASGALADVNTLLAGVSFNPTLNFNGNFTVTTSVSDGVAAAITGSKAFNGTPVNDAPTATNLSAAEAYTEDTALNLTDIVASDVDSANVTATLTLSNIAAGALSTATSGAVSSTYAADTGMWSASGALADVNTLLAGVSFNPTLNFNGNFTVTTSVSDGVAAAITGSKAFNGTPVNDAPVTAPVALGSSPEDAVISITPAQLLTGVTDLDTAPASLNITALSIASGGGVLTPFFVSPGWSYTPAADYSGPVTFNYTASDGQLGSPGTASLTITPVNDAPTATNLSAAEAYTEDTALNLTDIVASDVDSANVTATLTLSNIAAGALSTATSGAVTSTYAADTGVWSASGALADVNALLAGVTFNPAGNFNSAFTLATSVSVSDGVAPAITGAKAFTGTPVNDAPVLANAIPDGVCTAESEFGFTVAASTFSDVDNSTLTYEATLDSGAALPTWLSFNSATLNFSGTPTVGDVGTLNIKVTASDGRLSAFDTFALEIGTAPNAAPVAITGSASGAEDTVINGTAAASDVDSATLTYSLVQQAAHGTVSVNANGSYSYTPQPDYNGPDSFTFKANDGTVDSNVATVSLTVTAVNDAPVASTASASGAEDTVINGTATASDIDSALLTYSLVQQASHGTVSVNANGSYSYTPQPDYNGPDSFTFKANDGTVDSNVATVTLSVTAVNDAPVAATASASGAEDTVINGTAVASDIDSALLTYSLVQQASHGTVSVNANGSYSYTPQPDYNGPDSFTFKANDGTVDSNVATVTLSVTAVNDAPVAATASASGAEDTVINGTAVASDIDSALLTYSLVQQASHGTVSVNANGSYSYTPQPDYNGPDSFTFKANDGTVDSNVATVTLSVTAVNDAPVASTASASGAEDTVITGTATASDIDSALLTYSLVQQASHGTVSVNANGSYSYTPQPDYNGPDSFTFKANDGTVDSNVATVSLTVTAVNDAPVASTASASGAEDTVINGTATASDIDSALLTYSLVQQASHGTVSVNANGSYSYTPQPDYNGPDSFTFKANDGTVDSNVATVTLSVTAVNDAPVAATASASGAEDTVINGTAVASDIDSALLTYSLVQQASHGTVSVNANGSYSYTPQPDYNGPDSFTFKANDGTVDSNVATVTLSVTAVNDAPVAATASASGAEDTVITGTATASDIDSATLTYSLVQQATHGTVSVSAKGGYSYTPNANYFGPDSFTFKANDGTVDSNVATVTLSVTAVNDAPVAATASASGAEDTVINGTAVTSDIDSATLAYSLVQQASHGTVSVNANGSYSYTPQPNYNGPDSFTFKVNDGALDSNVATLLLTVTPVNDALSGSLNLAGELRQGQTLSLVSFLNDPDGIGQTSVEWLRDGTPIAGAGANNYLLVAADVGAAMSVRISYTDGGGALERMRSASTETVLAANPAADVAPPTVVAFVPADEATGVAIAGNIVLTFSELITRGAGSVTLKTLAGATIESFDAASSTRLAISGNTLTINPSADLAIGTRYGVEFAAGTLKDLAGNSYAGTTNYDFTTAGLSGTDGNDQLQGTGGNDTFTPGLGNDSIDAGDGVDTVILPMFPNVFSLSENPAGRVSGAYAGNTLVLNGVEFVQFGTTFKTTIPLSELLSGEAQLQLGRLTDLYLAFFGRAPDVTGLEFWQEKLLENQWSLTALAIEFAWSAEAQALFPQNGSNRDFVRTVYQNCFGREPDPGGWDYWTGRLDGLGVTDLSDRGAFVGAVILGAYAPSSGGEDRALMTNRHDAAMYYVNKLAVDLAEGFDAGINTLLARVTGDPVTEDKAEQVIDYAFANPITLTGVMTDQGLLNSIWGA